MHFYDQLDPLVRAGGHEAGVVSLLRAFSLESEGYKEVWRKLIEYLRARREAISGALTEEGGSEPANPSEVDQVLEQLQRRLEFSRRSMLEVGIHVQPPFERGLMWAYMLSQGASGFVDKKTRDPALRNFSQKLYDQGGNGAGFLRQLLTILEPWRERIPEVGYLYERLMHFTPGAVAKILRQHGLKVKSREEASTATRFQSGDRERGQQGAESRLRQRARLSAMKREALREEETGERGYRYAGRRKDVRDYRGHHPFITSLAAANLARQLTVLGQRWLYCQKAFYLEPTEGGPGGYLEPDFWLPNESRYIILISDRRDGSARARERVSWFRQIQKAHPELDLELIDDLHLTRHGLERGAVSERIRAHERWEGGRSYRSVSGPNIATHPERFALEGECPCALCSGKRVHPEYEATSRRTGLGVPGRRRR